jgi:hypothetical protein
MCPGLGAGAFGQPLQGDCQRRSKTDPRSPLGF